MISLTIGWFPQTLRRASFRVQLAWGARQLSPQAYTRRVHPPRRVIARGEEGTWGHWGVDTGTAEGHGQQDQVWVGCGEEGEGVEWGDTAGVAGGDMH